MRTLQKSDGTLTADMRETLTVTLEQLILEDNLLHDTEYHRAIRSLAEQPIGTPNYKDFTQDEVSHVVEGFKPRQTPGPDGITNLIQQVYKGMPKTRLLYTTNASEQGAFPLTGKRQEYFQ